MNVVTKIEKFAYPIEDKYGALLFDLMSPFVNGSNTLKILNLLTKAEVSGFGYIDTNHMYTIKNKDSKLSIVLKAETKVKLLYLFILSSDQYIEKTQGISNRILDMKDKPVEMQYAISLNNMNNLTSSDLEIQKQTKEINFVTKTGMDIAWRFIVDFRIRNRSKIPKEILLKAPAYKVQELENGCVFVQLTEEEPLIVEFDEEYVAAFLEFYEYCKNYLDTEKANIK